MSSVTLLGRPRLERVLLGGMSFLQGLAFWTAVMLALAYPLLFIARDSALIDARVFLGVIAVHVIVTMIGHGHQPSEKERSSGQ